MSRISNVIFFNVNTFPIVKNAIFVFYTFLEIHSIFYFLNKSQKTQMSAMFCPYSNSQKIFPFKQGFDVVPLYFMSVDALCGIPPKLNKIKNSPLLGCK